MRGVSSGHIGLRRAALRRVLRYSSFSLAVIEIAVGGIPAWRAGRYMEQEGARLSFYCGHAAVDAGYRVVDGRWQGEYGPPGGIARPIEAAGEAFAVTGEVGGGDHIVEGLQGRWWLVGVVPADRIDEEVGELPALGQAGAHVFMSDAEDREFGIAVAHALGDNEVGQLGKCVRFANEHREFA